MSKIRDLIHQRVSTDNRPEIRVPINLDPRGTSRLHQLQQKLDNLPEPTGKTKLNGPRAQLESEIADLQAQLDTSQATILLRTLTSSQAAKATASVSLEDEVSRLWKQVLGAAFIRCESPSGDPVDDVTKEDWTLLLDHLSATELHHIYQTYSAADNSFLD